MTKPKSIKGGLVLTDKSLTGFAPVVKMLQSGSARIQVLTANSLQGFMFTLNVNREDSTYRHFRFINGAHKITNFIIKIVVITETVIPLPKFGEIKKSSETETSFLTEAQLQQTVWIRNITGGKREFSPSVANFALFDRVQSLNLLKCLGAKGDRGTIDVIHYLSTITIDLLNLGVLLMPLINNSVGLYTYLHINPDKQNIAYCHTIANVVKLFIIVNVIHWDLHAANAMIDKNGESFLIDFGRASDIREPKNDDYHSDSYLSVEEKEKLYRDAKSFRTRFESMIGSVEITNKSRKSIKRRDSSTENSQKNQFMEEVCRYLTGIERDKSGNKFGDEYRKKGYYQMYWMEKVYNSPDKDDIFQCAYEKLVHDYLTSSVQIKKESINAYMRDLKLFDLYKDVDSYYYDFPPEIVLPSLNSLYKNPSAVVKAKAVSPVKVAPKNAFSSFIFLEHATPGTPVTLEDITLEDSDQDYTHQDYSSGLQVDQRDYSRTSSSSSSTRRPIYRTKITASRYTGSRFTGRGTKKRKSLKRKTRNTKSKK